VMSNLKTLTREERYKRSEAFTMMLDFGPAEAIKKPKKQKIVRTTAVQVEDKKEV
jgi:hypothetical protein